MKIKIKNHFNSEIMFSVEAESLSCALTDLIAKGANLRGADLSGANLSGANLSGANVFSVPASVATSNYNIFMTETHIKIGCQFHLISDWFAFSKESIERMDGDRALKFWAKWKPRLMEIAKDNGWMAL